MYRPRRARRNLNGPAHGRPSRDEQAQASRVETLKSQVVSPQADCDLKARVESFLERCSEESRRATDEAFLDLDKWEVDLKLLDKRYDILNTEIDGQITKMKGDHNAAGRRADGQVFVLEELRNKKDGEDNKKIEVEKVQQETQEKINAIEQTIDDLKAQIRRLQKKQEKKEKELEEWKAVAETQMLDTKSFERNIRGLNFNIEDEIKKGEGFREGQNITEMKMDEWRKLKGIVKSHFDRLNEKIPEIRKEWTSKQWKNWSTQNAINWFCRLDRGAFEKWRNTFNIKFLKNDIKGSSLDRLDEHFIVHELRIKDIVEIKRLVYHVRTLTKKPVDESAEHPKEATLRWKHTRMPDWTPHDVMEWFQQLPDTFKQWDMPMQHISCNGRLLAECNDLMLLQLLPGATTIELAHFKQLLSKVHQLIESNIAAGEAAKRFQEYRDEAPPVAET